MWAGDREQRERVAAEAAERAVLALPDTVDEGEVEEVLRSAWRGAVEQYVKNNSVGWTDTEREAAVRMALRESEGNRPALCFGKPPKVPGRGCGQTLQTV